MSEWREPRRSRRIDQYNLRNRKLQSNLPTDLLTRIWANADDRDTGSAVAAIEAIRARRRDQRGKR